MSEKIPNNKIETTPSHEQLEAWAERFSESLDDAVMGAQELGARTTLEDMLSIQNDERLFGELSPSEQAKLKELLEAKLGTNSTPLREREIEGTKGTPGEGKIRVSTFGTNQEGVFVRKYRYQDGTETYSVGPEEFEDE